MSEQTVRYVLEAARLLFQADQAVEALRVPVRANRVISGYFSDFEKLAVAAAELEKARHPGIYWTLNPVNEALLARADNRLLPYAKETTGQNDILSRRWFPVDLDPKRPAGISSTDREHDGSITLGGNIESALASEGWPNAVFADSGNGAHLLYGIDLPNDAESADLLRRCLKALAARFDNPIVQVDLKPFDAPRIFKVYGTTARKGDSTKDRPHRVAKILRVPALLEPVSIDQLRTLAALAPEEKKPAQAGRSNFRLDQQQSVFDLRGFLDRYGVRYRAPVPYNGGRKYTLECCPFDPSHRNKDAAVFEYSDGYAFKCFHNSCEGRNWQEFRQHFDPAAYSERRSGRQSRTPHPAERSEMPAAVWLDGEAEEEAVTRDEVKKTVDAAIAAGDLDSVLLMIPEIAGLGTVPVLRIKSGLVEKFGRKFRIRDFEQAIRDERRRPLAGLPPEDSSLPIIVVNNRPMRDVVADSLQALRAANDPPFLFVRSSQMVFVEIDEQQRPAIEAVEKAHLRGRLDRAANYVRRGEHAQIAVAPPIEIVEDILALPSAQWGVPPLEFVVEVPTLRPDGTILSVRGYDPRSRMLYAPAAGFAMKPIPDYIDADHLDAAIALVDEAICDFPFADEKDGQNEVMPGNPNRANLIALFLTPIVRPAISGAVPLALIDAPQAGTGKSLLVDLFSVMVTGRNAAMMPFPRSEDEMVKSIGATLLAGRALVCFDNIEGILQSPTLALVLTAKEYEARILGVSENMIAPNRATWAATGNNIRPSGDMPRRCYHIRLDAKKSRPYQGRQFKHENLLDWAHEARPELLRSLLMIARAYFQRGEKAVVKDPWGSFEDWHRTMAGIMEAAGIEGFLGNLQTFLAEADDMAVQWEGFLLELGDAFDGGQWFTVGTIVRETRGSTPLTPARFTLPDSLADVDRKKEGSLERSLGKSFAKRMGTRYGDREVHLERRFQKHSKQAEWRVLSNGIEVKPPVAVKESG